MRRDAESLLPFDESGMGDAILVSPDAYGPLWANVTPSTKPEARNVALQPEEDRDTAVGNMGLMQKM